MQFPTLLIVVTIPLAASLRWISFSLLGSGNTFVLSFKLSFKLIVWKLGRLLCGILLNILSSAFKVHGLHKKFVKVGGVK
jgi:ABC-type thiamin/hydroxymethylpyrimidine transport system permease subunit